MFVHSYMHESRFGVDENRRTVLMGFGDIGVVPETFLAFALPASIRLHLIAAPLGLADDSESLRSMAKNPRVFVDEGRYYSWCVDLRRVQDFN
jgi:hypothetical protein